MAAVMASMLNWSPTCAVIAAAAFSGESRMSLAPKLSGLSRPSCRLASVTVGFSPPRSYAAGPGSEPALWGPIRIWPSESMLAIEPPPAPISIISMTGIEMGMPLPFLNRVVRATSKVLAV